MSFATRSIQWIPFWPTPVFRNFSSGYKNSMKPRFFEASVVELGSQESTDSLRFRTSEFFSSP